MPRAAPPALLLLAALSLGIGSCPDRPGPGPTPEGTPDAETRPSEAGDTVVRVAFLGGMAGYLEPCGCVAGMLGGIPKTAGRLEALAAEGPLLVLDAGNTYHDGKPVAPAAEDQVELKARTLAHILERLEAQSVPGPDDHTLPATHWKDLVGARALVTREAGVTARRFEVGGLGIGVIGVTAPAAAAEDLPARVAAARKTLSDLALTLLLTPAKKGVLVPHAGDLGDSVDAVLFAGLDAPTDGEKPLGLTTHAVPFLRPMSQGRGIGVLELRVPAGLAPGSRPRFMAAAGRKAKDLEALDRRIARAERNAAAAHAAGNEELARAQYAQRDRLAARHRELSSETPTWPDDAAAFIHRFEAIAPDLPEAPWAHDRVKAYDEALGKANLAWAKAHGEDCPTPAEGKPQFVGAIMCQGCHEEADAFWKKTPHASAWETLTAQKKDLDLECVGCHVTGWQQPSGLCRLDTITEANEEGGRPGVLTGIQCEVCHGPGSLHVSASDENRAATIRTDPPSSVCTTCHVANHSPHFDPEVYRGRILGPGHGAPLPK